MNAAEIARHLHGHKPGAGWMARCPSRDDKNPWPGVRDADGKVSVHCKRLTNPESSGAAG